MEKNVSIEKYVAWYARPLVHTYLYFFVGFLVPFSLGHPQQLVGTIVNAVLILSVIELGLRKTVPLLFAPSLAVLARGVIFGPFTPFLVVMLPFIWAGNAMLVWIVSEFYKNRKSNYGITLGAAAAVKSGFLYSTTLALVSLSIVPAVFLATMGIDQLATALAGGVVAFGLRKSGILKLASF